MENNLENAVFRIRIEGDKTPLFHGTIWECERWIRKYGERDVPYCIIRLKKKGEKK